MIYLLEFLRGASWALLVFGALYSFFVSDYSYYHLFFGTIPGLALVLIVVLFIQNYELKKRLKNKNLKI